MTTLGSGRLTVTSGPLTEARKYKVSVSSEVAPVKLSVPVGLSCGQAVRDAALPTTGPNAIVVVMDDTGALRDLSWVPTDTVDVSPVPINSPEGRSVLRHSLAHLTAQAVQELFPEARLGIGPPIENGYYYDFLIPRPFTPQDLQDIEARMRRIIKRGQSFRRRVFDSVEEAKKELLHEPLKLELIESKANTAGDEAVEVGGGELSIYDNIDMPTKEVVWSDLCRGPHLPSTRYIGAFKLMRNAAAYWRGSEANPQLQRIYGTAWESQEALDHYLWLLAEAERRDHRRLGKELELFHLDPTAPGMPYWLPKGLRLLNNLLDFWREEHEDRGYQEISSPLINHRALWDTSGHWEHYRKDMFIIGGDEASAYGVKPMNCPNAMVVYNLKTRSYRDLPLRFSDCDPLHRNERSGTLHGLLRVQKFQQDDAHIFVMPHQIEEEYERIFDICERFYGIFDLTYTYRLGTRPDDYIGDLETWDEAERILTRILQDRTGGDFGLEAGGGAFYGPKIDIMMKDALGREWQMGTIQLDFQLPRRFGCEYTDDQGKRKTPVVIHRVIYGSLERFLGIYIEHTAGAFPLWIAPLTAVVIPVARDYEDYARHVQQSLRCSGARTELDARDETLNSRIRSAQLQKVPLTIVVGAQEKEHGTVAVRKRGKRDTHTMSLVDLVSSLTIAKRDRLAELPTG
jgi:threonyl-tRNA synthetase